MKHPDITVVVPTHNKVSQLQLTLRALASQTLDPNRYEVIVVDNNSTDSTRDHTLDFANRHRQILYVFEGKHGRSAARNAGISAARGAIVLLLDDDILVASDHLERHLAAHEGKNNRVIISNVIDCSPYTPKYVEAYFHNRQFSGSGGAKGATGADLVDHARTGDVSIAAALLGSIRAVSSHGQSTYLDTKLARREDTDLARRLQYAGGTFHFAEDIVSFHYHPRTWRSILRETYIAGRSLYLLDIKYPQRATRQRVPMSSRVTGWLFLAAGYALLPAGFLLRWMSSWPMHKALAAILIGVGMIGYWDQATESNRADQGNPR